MKDNVSAAVVKSIIMRYNTESFIIYLTTPGYPLIIYFFFYILFFKPVGNF